MTEFVTAGAGFLLAVVWFDLMFDVQVLRHRGAGRELADEVVASIAAYYRRVTTAARPMNRLVGAVMLATLATTSVQLAEGDAPRWAAATSLGLVVLAILIVVTRTFGSAVRLGARTDPPEIQARLARSICTDHLVCLAAMVVLLTIQLGFAR